MGSGRTEEGAAIAAAGLTGRWSIPIFPVETLRDIPALVAGARAPECVGVRAFGS